VHVIRGDTSQDYHSFDKVCPRLKLRDFAIVLLEQRIKDVLLYRIIYIASMGIASFDIKVLNKV